MATLFHGSILRRLQNRGAQAGAAKGFGNPQYVNRKPSESELSDKAAHHLAVGGADVNIKGSEWIISEVRSIELLEALSDQGASGRLGLLGHLDL